MKFLYSFIFAFIITEISSGIIHNPTLETSIVTIFGALLSFLVFQVLKFFLKKFLEKKLNYNELSYIKAGCAIVFPSLLCLILTFSCLFISVSGNVEEEFFARQWQITIENPFFWLFAGNIFLFSFRIPIMKEKLITLQKAFKES